MNSVVDNYVDNKVICVYKLLLNWGKKYYYMWICFEKNNKIIENKGKFIDNLYTVVLL